MADITSDIEAALLTHTPLPRKQVLHWIDNADDLRTLARLYQLTGEGYSRIQPNLGKEVVCGLVQRYLLECIKANITNDEDILSQREAAQVLHGWFCRLLEMEEDNSAVLKSAAAAITSQFLASGEEVRNVIETGFLEHALETAALRPYFEHWSGDDRLREAWNRALEWGKAHPDFTRRLLQQLRRTHKR
jgi:hypothetical protein